MGAIEKKEHSDEHLSEASTPHVKKFKDDCDSTASTPISERLPPYARTWSNDFFNFPSSSGSRWTPRIHSSWNSRSDDDLGRAWQKTKSGVRRNWDVISNDSKKWHWNKKETWSTVKSSARRWSVARKHLCAVLLLITFGLLPVGIVGYYTPRKYYAAGVEPFYGAFQDKVVGCNGPWNDPKDSLTHGLENLFVLDATFGHYTFAQVKLIDVAWDVLLGRSVQLLAWWIGYVVFSGALLRAIERHSASFQIFQSIALEGPSLMSLWTLLQEMWRSKSKRTRMLFAYMWMSTMYIMCIQMFLGAMTGYDSTNVAFVGLNGTDNLVPVAAVQRATIIKGTVNETFDHPICLDYSWDWPMYQSFDARRQYCDCEFLNGTIAKADRKRKQYTSDWSLEDLGPDQPICRFNFPGNNQTFRELRELQELKPAYNQTFSCNHAYTIPANATSKSIQYEALDLNLQSGYCFEDHGYPLTALLDQTRCLPDTANPSYSWGFSTMLSAIFVFIHLAWCVTMWIVWVDAQVYSTLVKSGYEMSPLRAAFAMAQSASWKTGLSAGQLVRADATEVQQECYGVKGGTTGVEIGAELFRKEDIQGAEDRDRDLRRRTRRQEKDNVSVETRRIVT